MRLSDLVDQLHKMGVIRATNADPRKPPILEIGNETVKDGDEEISVFEVSVQDFLKPIKALKETDIMLDTDWPEDWLEECDAYSVIFQMDDPVAECGWMNGTEKPYVDCWAWYCPFHFYEDEAGIYIRGDKLSTLSLQILSISTPAERKMLKSAHPINLRLFGQQIKQAAFLHLFIHEMYHHKLEAFATRLEISTGMPKFVPYYDSVYSPLSHPLTDALIEEGLANAEVLRRVTGDPTYRSKQFPRLPGCPNVRVLWERFEFYANQMCSVPGYRTVRNYIKADGKFSKIDFTSNQMRLQQMVSQTTPKPLGDPGRWAFAPGMMAPFWNKDIIAYEVLYPGASSRLVPRGAIRAVQASPRKVLRVARKWGITKAREADGDHTMYRGQSGRKVSIDTGYNDLPNACWKGLIEIVNMENGLSLKNNQEGRRRFLAGP